MPLFRTSLRAILSHALQHVPSPSSTACTESVLHPCVFSQWHFLLLRACVLASLCQHSYPGYVVLPGVVLQDAHQALVHLVHVRQCCSDLVCVCVCAGQVLLQRDECCCVGVMWVCCNPVCVCAVLCPPSCGWFAADMTRSGWCDSGCAYVCNQLPTLIIRQLYHNMSAVHAVGWCLWPCRREVCAGLHAAAG